MKDSNHRLYLLRSLAIAGMNIFSIKDAQNAAKKLNMKSSYVPQALHHLVKLGWISRLKKGLYSFHSQSGIGMLPHDFEIAMALVNPSAISHWTALHYHHLTEQTPNKVFAITPTNTSIPRNLKKTIFRFIQVKKKQYFGFEKVWVNQEQILITDPERTLLDGLMRPEFCGDFQEVLHAFKMLGDKINIDRIIKYALKLNVATAKRLGWILEKLGFPLSQMKDLLQLPIKGYRKLDPTGPLQGPLNKKWMIQENL